MNALIHTRELELAARDFIDSYRPDYDLSARVNKYTNWEGEINEIVHYSKANIRGIEVLVNMVLSDYCGDTRNIETIFNPSYRFFGVRVFAHDLYDYCCVCIYAEDIYSSLKSTLYTSANIDDELLFERQTLGRKIAEKSNYAYSARYARDNPEVRLSMYFNESKKSKRKVRLTENHDGERTFTVLRRDSLERNPNYKYHADADYLYVDRQNERFTHVPAYARPSKNHFNLGRGETIVQQKITDIDKEIYTKHLRPRTNEFKHDFYAPPHQNRHSTIQEYNTRLYYGDLNDVSRFEEDLIQRYTTIIPESCPGNHNHVEVSSSSDDSIEEAARRKSYFRSSKSAKRHREHQVQNSHYASYNKVQKESSHSRYSLRSKERAKAQSKFGGVDVSFREEELFSPGERDKFATRQEPYYGRFSKISEIPRVSDPPEIKKTVSYNSEMSPQKIAGYRMTERESARNSVFQSREKSPYSSRRSERAVVQETAVPVSKGLPKSTFFAQASPERAMANRPTSYSSVHKRKTREERDFTRELNDFNLSDTD